MGASAGSGWGYLLLLAGHEGLVARGCPKAQLVDGGRLLLAVDLQSDPHLKRGLLCRGKGTLRPVSQHTPCCRTLSPGL